MAAEEMTWRDAILRVLEEAQEPLDTPTITKRIEENGYRELTGESPNRTVSSYVSIFKKEGIVEEPTNYYYNLAQQDLDLNAKETEPAQTLTVQAYGLYWERSAVRWDTGRRELMGKQDRYAQAVNFADQAGVYLLHSWNEIVYAGKTNRHKSKNGLYDRLKDHHTSVRKNDRWNTFSWFGFKAVQKDGNLGNEPDNCSFDDIVDIIEAIFIEALLPRLNMQSGSGMNELREDGLYSQF